MDTPPWAPTLTDGVVTLRAHRVDDVPDITLMCQDPQMVRWTSVPSPYGEADATAFVRSRRSEWDAARSLTFALEAEGRYGGSLDLRPDGTAASVGFALAPWARGRGLCTRGLRLLLDWAFDTLDLEVVHWMALTGNWASRQVAWAVGFRVEGTVRGLLAERTAAGGPAGVGPARAGGWIGSLRRGDPMLPSQSWHRPPVLTDGRVLLRGHLDTDTDRIVEACIDPVTQTWLPDLPARYRPANARAHLEEIRLHHATGVALYWAATVPGDPRLAGEVGLFGLSPEGVTRTAEVGYWAHPQARGRGLTTAAVRLAVRHALLPQDVGGLGARRVLVRVADGNLASQRVARQAGLRPCGRDRGVELLRDGSTCDLLRFDLTAGELVAAGSEPTGVDEGTR